MTFFCLYFSAAHIGRLSESFRTASWQCIDRYIDGLRNDRNTTLVHDGYQNTVYRDKLSLIKHPVLQSNESLNINNISSPPDPQFLLFFPEPCQMAATAQGPLAKKPKKFETSVLQGVSGYLMPGTMTLVLGQPLSATLSA